MQLIKKLVKTLQKWEKLHQTAFSPDCPLSKTWHRRTTRQIHIYFRRDMKLQSVTTLSILSLISTSRSSWCYFIQLQHILQSYIKPNVGLFNFLLIYHFRPLTNLYQFLLTNNFQSTIWLHLSNVTGEKFPHTIVTFVDRPCKGWVLVVTHGNIVSSDNYLSPWVGFVSHPVVALVH